MFRIPSIGRKGSVSVVGALVLPLLIGMTGLVAEYGNGVLAKTQDQRLADLAAYAGAVAYNSTNSTTTMTSVIDNVAALNGVAASDVSGSLVSSPSGDGNQAVEVTVNTTVPLVISRILNTGATLPVNGTAYAELKANTAGCVIALNSSGSGVTLSSASAVTADACAVDSNSTVSVPCSTTITTLAVNYDSASAPSQPCSGIQAPSGSTVKIAKTLTADPLAGNSEVATATARLASVAALSSPAAPSVASGPSISFGVNSATGSLPAGCSDALASGVWTVTCASGATYAFGSVTASSSAHVVFTATGSSATTYDFSGAITVSSASSMAFPAGTYNIAQGVTVASASSATFGAGTFDIGPGSSACSDGGKYSLCVESATSLVFGGPSTFVLSSGVYAGSSATVSLGSGSTNSFDVGASSNGYALNSLSASNTVFADATGASSLFELVGNVDATSASCVTLGSAPEHDINGAIIAASASNTTFGSGIYTVNGYVDDESASGGGGCGSTAGQSGAGVTFVLGGADTPSSGSCAGLVICVLSASSVSLTAPTTGATAGLAVIGPTSTSNTAGALFSSASSGSFSGAFYLPNGPITVSSASGLGGGSGACLELIGSQVTLSSASAVASSCISGASTTSSVILVR